MSNTAVEIEDIEAMRRVEGIEDVSLRKEIRGLAVGDLVNITFLAGMPPRGETVEVRITSIRGRNFAGELVRRPAMNGLSKLRAGAPVAFTAAHIHSLPKAKPALEH